MLVRVEYWGLWGLSHRLIIAWAVRRIRAHGPVRAMIDALYTYLTLASPPDAPNAPDPGRGRRREGLQLESAVHAPEPLLRQLQAADETDAQRAFEVVFRAAYPKLVRFAVQYVGQDAAEDVVDEVFASLWANRQSVTPRSTLDAYLFGAVRHRAISVYRQSKRHSRSNTPILAEGEFWGMGIPADAPDTVVASDNVRELMWRTIAELPARQREILMLRWQGELGWDAIAHTLGSTSAAVQMQHSRALKTLRQQLARYLI